MSTCRHYSLISGECFKSGVTSTPNFCDFAACHARCPHYSPTQDLDTTSGPQDQFRSEISTRLESMEKNVNHPKRYTKGKIECIDALESAVVGKTPEEAICVANVIKYLWRYEEKEPLRSLKSAEWYLKRLISKYETNYADND